MADLCDSPDRVDRVPSVPCQTCPTPLRFLFLTGFPRPRWSNSGQQHHRTVAVAHSQPLAKTLEKQGGTTFAGPRIEALLQAPGI